MSDSPNVLFLVVDSLRYDAVFGDDSFETPTLDRLAADGVVFDDCHSQGISTAPAMTAMLTGRHPLDYGGHWYIEESQPTMAEEFDANGYRTGAIHSNPNVSRLRNFHRGFDTFEENILPYETAGLLDAAPDKLLLYANKFVRILRRTPYMPAPRVNRKLADWVDATREPWFLWTQYMDVHGPYLPGGDFSYRNKIRAERLWRKAAVNAPDEVTPEEHRELLDNYRKEVEYFDAELGAFLDELEAGGHLENTLVVVVGDHGDEFMEHGTYGHGNLPYDELTHVPLVMSFPDGSLGEGGTRVTEQVRCVDVLPTALDLADATLSEEMERRMAGTSLLPVVEGKDHPEEISVTEKEMRGESHLRFGFRTRDWKFMYDGKHDERYLFDLEEDPDEEENVVEEHDEVRERFESVLEDRLESIEETGADIQIPDVDDEPGVEEQLRALGYQE
jgi:arylsulfatase A-like enzyme